MNKKRYYILYTINKIGITSEVIIQLLFQKIWEFYGFFDLVDLSDPRTHQQINKKNATNILDVMQSI